MLRLRGLTTSAVTLSAVLLVAACAGAAPLAEPSPSPAVTAAPTAAPTASPTSAPTATPAPTSAPTAASTPAGDPDDYGYGTPPTRAPSAAPAGSPSGKALEVLTSAEHGDYLAVDGRAVYLFTPDGNNTSTCFDDCALTWPPVTGSVIAGEGVTGTLGGFSRPSGGGRQVTYNGAPLYFYAADTAAGDTRGEGRGGVWFLVEP